MIYRQWTPRDRALYSCGQGTPTESDHYKRPQQTLCNFYGQGSSTEKGTLYRRCAIPTYKGPYRQDAPTVSQKRESRLLYRHGASTGVSYKQGSNILISASPNLGKIINIFNIWLFFKTLKIASNRKFCYIIADLGSNRMNFSHQIAWKFRFR